ncbi:MAG: phosphotransferase [bacterium]|nr:phosphotransferase [bacterium]
MSFQPLEFLLHRGLLQTVDHFETTPLTGGFWNDNVRVHGPDIDWVVKHYRTNPRTSLFPVLPQAEALALETLHQKNIAPDPVAFFPDAGPVLVYKYWPGDPWRENVIPVANLLYCLHNLPVQNLQGFRHLPVEPSTILAQGDALLKNVPEDNLVSSLRDRRPTPASTPAPKHFSLLHTDVGAGNLIVGPDGLRLIDWQCPGIGDPTEDVWAFLSPAFQILFDRAPLSLQDRETFLNTYDSPDVRTRLPLLAPAFAYRMTAYCCLRASELAPIAPALADQYRTAGRAQIQTLSP